VETKITATELARNLSDILNRVRYKGESFRVERNGEVVAVLAPTKRRGTTWGEFVAWWESVPKPDPEFWDDVEEARRLQGEMPDISAWDPASVRSE
jgi:prevent-host-death family protein